MPENPKPCARVSVIMPAFNVAAFVKEAISSIHAQTWADIELIVVDDGSVDGTGDVLDALQGTWTADGRRLEVLRVPNGGAAAARNIGLTRITGRYVSLFDADDVAHPALIARQVALLEARPELDLAFALYRYVDASGAVLSEQPAPPDDRLGTADLLADNIVHAPLFRADIVAETGPMDPALSAHIDLDFFLRVAARRERCIGVIPEALSDYRRHGKQITAEWRRMRQNYLAVLAKREAAGLRLSGAARRRVFGRLTLYWATLAYQAGDYASARRLIASSMMQAPRRLLADPHGRIRLMACMTSLLPAPLHGHLRRWFNGRRAA